MSGLFVSWAVCSVSLLLTAAVMPGMSFATAGGAVTAAMVMGIVNYTLKPLLLLFTLPLNMITFGFFSWIINGISLYVVALFTFGFRIESYWDAFLGSFLMYCFSRGLYMALNYDFNQQGQAEL
jgi:putative membrane protein